MGYQSRICDTCGGALQSVDHSGQPLARGVLFCPFCDSYHERKKDAATVSIINVGRQAVIDCANMRERSAADKVSEAQKIDGNHAVTLIIELLHARLLTDLANGVNQQLAARLIKARERFLGKYPTITDDEDAFYEAIDDASGYAVLSELYLFIRDKLRYDHVLSLVEVQLVDTEYANNKLLDALTAVNRTSEIERLLSGPNKFNLKMGLSTLLALPDGAEKVRVLGLYSEKSGIGAPEKKVLNAYLEKSLDRPEHKAGIAAAFAKSPARLDVEQVIRYSLSDTQDIQVIADTIRDLSAQRLTRNQIEQLINFVLIDRGQNYDEVHAGLSALAESKQPITISPQQCGNLIGYTRFSVDQLAELYGLCFRLGLDEHTKNVVLTDYLLGASESYSSRSKLAEKLIDLVGTVQLKTFESLLMSAHWSKASDANARPFILEQMMNRGVESRYCASIFSKYLESAFDTAEVRVAISKLMFSKQISPSASSMLVFSVAPDITSADKQEVLLFAQENGIAMPGNLLNHLISSGAFGQQSQGLLDFAFEFATILDDDSIIWYVLNCEEPIDKRRKHLDKVFEIGGRVGSQNCTIDYHGMRLSCNLAQAYALSNIDPADVLLVIIKRMESLGAKLKGSIVLDGNKTSFKKFYREHAKHPLSQIMQLA